MKKVKDYLAVFLLLLFSGFTCFAQVDSTGVDVSEQAQGVASGIVSILQAFGVNTGIYGTIAVAVIGIVFRFIERRSLKRTIKSQHDTAKSLGINMPAHRPLWKRVFKIK